MAIFDHEEAAHQQQKNESYEKLKESLGSKVVKNGRIVKAKPWTDKEFWKTARIVHHEHAPALEKMKDMEKTIEEQAKKIAEFEQFFATLRGFMPRQSSIHDIIG